MSEPENKNRGWQRWFDVTTPLLSLVTRLRGGRPVSEAWSKKRPLLPFLIRVFWFFFNRKMLRRYAFAFACLVTLIALAYGVENWRGKKAWETYKAEVENRGETLDFKAYIPSSVPDDQNFATIPLFRPLFQYGPRENWDSYMSANRFADVRGAERIMNIVELDTSAKEHPQGIWTNGWHTGTRLDMAAWQMHYRSGTNFLAGIPATNTPAADVLTALRRYDPVFAELKQGATKPYARFPLNYDNLHASETDTAYLSVIRQLVQVIRLQASARLQNGDTEGAAEDIDLMFRLANSVRQEPLVISQIVRSVMLRILMQPLWEGMQDQRWSAAQLDRWRDEMQGMHLLEDFQMSVLGQRALLSNRIIWVSDKPKRFLDDLALLWEISSKSGGYYQFQDLFPRPGPEGLIVYAIPRGWWRFEAVNFCRRMDVWLLNGLPGSGNPFDLERIRQGDAELQAWRKQKTVERRQQASWAPLLDHEMVIPFYYPEYLANSHIFTAQAYLDLAIAATLLERHRLESGAYPSSFDELPAHLHRQLPLDKMSGQPFRYQKEGDSFRLWSIGWDGKDDQGKLVEEKLVGDWIWHPRPLPVQAK